MTTPKNYCTIEDVKDSLNVGNTNQDAKIQAAISAASRLIEQYCDRYFWQDDEPTVKRFIPYDMVVCETDDFDQDQDIEVRTDTSGLRTFEVLWTEDDYQLEPINGLENGQPWPATRLRAVRSLYFPLWGSSTYPVKGALPLVQIRAKFGWPSVPDGVFQAAIIQSMAVMEGLKNPSGVSAFSETGVVRVSQYLHPLAKQLLDPYRRQEVLIL